MLSFIDSLINSITMYRLILYSLILIAVYAVIGGFLGILHFSGFQMAGSIFLLQAVCYLSNLLFSKIFKAPVNFESWSITALILFFLFIPANALSDTLTLILAGIIAMGSKYLLAISKKHIFNPVAVAAIFLSFYPSFASIWWVGNIFLLPVLILTGLLIIRKIGKFIMFFSFFIASLAVLFTNWLLTLDFGINHIIQMLTSGPVIFLGLYMLTEPQTTPPTKKLQIIYGAIVGILSNLQYNIGALYLTPELALGIGNIFSYLVSPKQKSFLYLKKKNTIAQDTYEFIFGRQKILCQPGQYLEWTLPHEHPDSRGVRRFFTAASSPGEEVKIGIKIPIEASSFKRRLLSLKKDDLIIASQIAGDFVLPDDKNRKLLFIAGGIGITPFRSMIKYLLDNKFRRDIILLYFNKNIEEIAYKEIFDQAVKEIGLKTIYVLTGHENIPNGWKGRVGRLDEKILADEVPDALDRIFYISGPNGMVVNYSDILIRYGIKKRNIKTDYFPGY